MSHEITVREDGKAEMAFTGPRSAIWHGLGNALEDGQSIEQWTEAAGMDFEILRANLNYSASVNGSKKMPRVYPDRSAFIRSDTGAALAINSPKFKIVQPKSVLEFFRDLTALHGFKLSTAGTLFGGQKFWALAEVGKEFEPVKGDKVQGHLLLVTACDGSMSTQARFVATRVVCNNTLTVALGERAKQAVKVTHKRDFDATQVKIDLNILDNAWKEFTQKINLLAKTKVTPAQAAKFLQEQFYDEDKATDDQNRGVLDKIEAIKMMALHGSGAEMSAGTAWGLLNGVTEYFTHGTDRRNASYKFKDSYLGRFEKVKTDFMSQLVAADL